MQIIKSKLYIYLFILFLGGFMVSSGQADEKGILIDVRTQAEWDQGHLVGANLIPYDEIATKIEALTKDKKQKINVYCRSGRRSGIAEQILIKLGYTNVQNLGGYEDLKSKGYKSTK